MLHARLPHAAVWRKSIQSNEQGACVEVADLPNAIGIRDSKHPNRPHLTVSRQAFANLTARVKANF